MKDDRKVWPRYNAVASCSTVDSSEMLDPDVDRGSDLRQAEAGVRMADFECPHGRLPGDRSEPCGCFDEDMEKALRDRVRESVEASENVYTCGRPTTSKEAHPR